MSGGREQDRPTVTIADAPTRHRYEALVDGELAGFAAYRRHGESGFVFTHTQIEDAYEGHGIGSTLARGALDDVRRRGGSVVAQCPFIASYIDRHPEYADLVEPTKGGA